MKKRLAALRGALAFVALTAMSASGSFARPAFAEEDAALYARHHRQLSNAVVRSEAAYTVPRVRLVRADGQSVWLADELDDGRPVILDFIYTTCTSICPLSSETFSGLQEKLGVERDHVHLVSISIDPEQDTPDRLTEYSKRFDAGAQWQFYTGTLAASQVVQRAFNAYWGSKMTHNPMTVLRQAPGRPWVRLDGFATVNELMAEIHDHVAAR